MDWISATIGKRRIEHATETMTDAAEEFGAETPEEFIEFLNAALADEEHQELLARALTIAQDTAMRDKRRALGRALASAASDAGTKVDDELIFIRRLADLDAPHIRCLRLILTSPPRYQWSAYEIWGVDEGLGDVALQLLRDLERLGLVTRTDKSDGHTGFQTDETEHVEYRALDAAFPLLQRLEEPEAL
jgi:hypothetical protein